MKTKLIMTMICVLEVTISHAQTIRIADNNAARPTGANIYSTLQAAIDAAVPGDLVYVQPSPTNYGDVTVDRSITLRGVGFNTGKDIALPSTVGNIGLTNTISNSTNANGTVIEGISANGIQLGYQTGTFTFTLQNITISNCVLNYVGRSNSGYVPAQNITIQNNSIYGIDFSDSNIGQLLIYGNLITGGFVFGIGGQPGGSPFGGYGGGTLSSTIISNNIITQSATNQFYNTTISALAITNNIFIGGTNKAGSRFITGQLTDATVTNNIFYGATPGSNGGPFERNSFLNNISYGTSADAIPPTGTGVGNTGSTNQVSVDPKFTNAAYGAAYTATMDFTLQAGSTAKNAGTDGTDIGITGGAYPVAGGNIVVGAPHAPVIMTLNPAAIVPQSQPILTNIKAKSN
jgi:hypothetical protein